MLHQKFLVADIRTQASYQLMDERFFGLIFSVFNEDKTTKVFSLLRGIILKSNVIYTECGVVISFNA